MDVATIVRPSKSTTRKKISQKVLDMTVNKAVEFFKHIPKIERKLKTIQELGLGYVTLGQPATTLSGGKRSG